MKRFALHYEGIVIKFPQHKYIKQELLSLIDNTKSEKFGSVSRTDWKSIEDDLRYRRYFDLFINQASPLLRNVFYNFFKLDKRFNNPKIFFWFQQYTELSHHPIHDHLNSDYSLVYFLDLPSKDSTVFYNQFYDTYQTVEAEEGDIIIFPSIHQHTSLPSNQKTVIAMNFRFFN